MTDVLTLFFALLALMSLAGAVTIVLLSRGSRRGSMIAAVAPYALPGAATVATVATLGSLYLSEIANFVPCRLCWVQRGFMYPLVLILWLALWKRWDGIWKFAVPWSIVGAVVGIYHSAEQRGWLGGESFCSATAPCSQIWVQHFGFVTIPFMALSGFLLVAALTWVHGRAHSVEHQPATTRSN